jgi:tetratricopeptide (TPR) repeat protein
VARHASVLSGLAVVVVLGAAPGTARADGQNGPWSPALRGTALALRGDLRGAADALRPLAQHIAPGPGQLALGLVALQARDAPAALRAFDRAVAAGDTAPELFYWRGIALLRVGRRAAAVADLERAATLASDRPEYMLALASVRADPELVLAAAEVEPNLLSTVYYPEPRRGLARVCARLLRDLPARTQVRSTVARLLYDARLPREAEDWLARIEGLTPEEHALLGRIALDRGDLPAAREHLGLATRSEGSTDARALYDLARAEVASGRRAEAAVILRRAIDVDPSVPTVLVAAGELARDQGDLPRAAELAGYALARTPDFPPALRLHGQVLLARGALDDAWAALRRAATLAPGDPVVWATLAELAPRRGQTAARARAIARRGQEAQRLADEIRRQGERARVVSLALERVATALRAGADASVVDSALTEARRAGAPARAVTFATVAALAKRGRRDEALALARSLAGHALPLARWARTPAAPNMIAVRGRVDGREVESVAVLDDLLPSSL